MYVLLVRFELPDEVAAAAFDEAAAQAVPLIRSREPGTLRYETYAVEQVPLTRVFFEVYADRDAHAVHETQPHTSEFLTRARALASRIQVDELTGQDPGHR